MAKRNGNVPGHLAIARAQRPLTAQEIANRMDALEGNSLAAFQELANAFNGNAEILAQTNRNCAILEERLRACEVLLGLRPPDAPSFPPA